MSKSERRIIVTRKWPEAVEKELWDMCDNVSLNTDDRPMTKAELQTTLREADCVLPTVTDPIDAEVLSIGDMRCRFLGNFGVGFNHIDLDAAKKAGLVVTNTPEVLTDCTADIAMTLMMMIARRAGEGERHLRNGEWTGWRPTHMVGTKVTGKMLGLIGFGRIAYAMARKAHFGFDMDIAFYNPYDVSAAAVEAVNAKRCETLESLLEISDFVSIHCPGGKETYHLIDVPQLERMKPSAYLINTARGDVVNNAALIAALKNNTIRGVGLDVYENEPQFDPGFLELENAVLLPHLGSASEETRIAMGRRVLENLRAWFDDKPPADRVA